MLKVLRLFLLGSLSLISISCATTQCEEKDINKDPGALDLILCEEPRPQICTREYDPVCAMLQDGSVKTYATGCTSCSDAKVEGYKKGACGVVSLDNSESVTP
jgi:hypothetical protein